jgi:hypothetical protein
MAAGLSHDTVLYLYGISKNRASLANLVGVDGAAAVEPVECSGLIAWVSRVARGDYADNLVSNMENLDWLAERSVQHQRVVSALAKELDVLPARFGTVFLNESSLAADVRAKKSTLQSDLEKIKDSDEFGVKVFAAPPRVAPPVTGSASGKDYLKAKAALLQRRPAKERASAADFQGFSQELQRLAVSMAEAGKISAGQRGLQWQVSVLLRRSDRKKFEALLRKYSRQWAGERQIECTGPWPPYSFVSRPRVKS